MATYLADTNLLLRLADPASSQHPIATDALARLFRQADEVFLTPQNFIEFWAVAARLIEANGLGWSSERTAQEVGALSGRQDAALYVRQDARRHEPHCKWTGSITRS